MSRPIHYTRPEAFNLFIINWLRFILECFSTPKLEIGIIDTILLLLKSFSLAKFLTLILKFIAMFFVFFQGLWKTWIQPYIDLIIVTILFTFIEKIPVIGPLFRRIRITIKWKWRHFKHRREHVMKHHVDANVNAWGEKIHKHVNKKKEILAAKVQDKSQRPVDDERSENEPDKG